MNKFKVGDIVIGNKKANDYYTISKEGFIGEVVTIHGKFMEIRDCTNYYTTYTVYPHCFDLYKEKGENKMNKEEMKELVKTVLNEIKEEESAESRKYWDNFPYEELRAINDFTDTKLIIAEPYTILIEGDEKTKVKANEEDYNQFKGVVMALLQHKLGISYSKLKYLLYDMKKGDEELVLAKFLLNREGIKTPDIQKLIKEANIQVTVASAERAMKEYLGEDRYKRLIEVEVEEPINKSDESTEKLIKKAKVVSPLKQYSTYKDFFKYIGREDLEPQFSYGKQMSVNVLYNVITSGKHETQNVTLYVLEHPITKELFIIGEPGIEFKEFKSTSPIVYQLFDKRFSELTPTEKVMYRQYLKRD